MSTPWRLVRRDGGATVAATLEIADGPWSRFVGLQFRAALPPGAGLLLVPCPSVHTFFMRFPIDVVLIDRRGCVVAVRRRVRPWRIVLPVFRAYAALELPADSADLEPGVALGLETTGPNVPPRSLNFLCAP